MRQRMKLLFICVLLWECCKAQEINPDFMQTVSSQIVSFHRQIPHEKAYLSLDNHSYFVGDTLWFKAWLVYAPRHISVDWSKTLYVDLLNQEGHLIHTKRFKLIEGQCHGEMVLPDSLLGGYYEIRAYTRWMLNFGSGYEFSRVFPVFSKPKNVGVYKPDIAIKRFTVPDYRVNDLKKWRNTQENSLLVNFFPEGGYLVKGLSSQIAFKVVNNEGENVDGTVVVKNHLGERVVSAVTVHDGMGVFSLCPDGYSYFAEFIYKEKNFRFPLPMALEEGCVLHVNTRDTATLKLHIGRSSKMREQRMGLMILCRGEILFSGVLQPSRDEMVSFLIPTGNIPSGVSQIVLFSEEGDILAERMVFINHWDQLKIRTIFDRPEYPPFGKINMAVQVTAPNGLPVQTGLCVAIRDASVSYGYEDTDNLQSYLLLSSELRGYIHRPGYYFVDNSSTRRYALDLLMLVQGWSRYSWKQMSGCEDFRIQHPAEEAISIDGQVLNYGLRSKPLKDVELQLWMRSGKEFYKNKCRTDSLGRFVFGYELWGLWDLTLQVKDHGKYKNCDIRLNRWAAPGLRKISFYEQQQPVLLKGRALSVADDLGNKDTVAILPSDSSFIGNTYLLEEARVKQRAAWRPEDIGLKDATIVYRMESVMDQLKDQGKDKVVTIFDFLQQYNPYYYTERPIAVSDKYKGRPVIYVINNVYSEEYGTLPLESIVPEQVDYIAINESYGVACQYLIDAMKEEKGEEMGRLDNCENYVVIYIYTTPGHRIRNSQKGIRQTTIDGYSFVREFYSPIYNRKIYPGETDYRRTLYWNPCVKTDSTGKAKVMFYNNSTCRKMDISVETITEQGGIGVCH